jgi:cadmium resistance transport/sequestration family protein
MQSVMASIAPPLFSFIVTNIDDLFILMLFFSQTGQGFKKRHVVIGQYLGFGALVLVSLFGYAGSLFLPRQAIALLGIFPIAIGVKALLDRSDDETPELAFRSSLAVSAVTFANGGDNIGIYIPFFANYQPQQLAIVILIFLLMVAVWCFVALVLIRQRAIANLLQNYGGAIVPFVFIALGVYIVWENLT